MKYQQEITIELPIERVIELFDNTENLKEWQEGLKSFEHVSGEPGKEGAKSKLVFDTGKRRLEMIETITKRNFPDEFHGTYETKGVYNIQENYFSKEGKNSTKWFSKSEFKFSGFMAFLAVFMKGAFKKQSYHFMESFKKFAEERST